jgi:hypothetical protein
MNAMTAMASSWAFSRQRMIAMMVAVVTTPPSAHR